MDDDYDDDDDFRAETRWLTDDVYFTRTRFVFAFDTLYFLEEYLHSKQDYFEKSN